MAGVSSSLPSSVISLRKVISLSVNSGVIPSMENHEYANAYAFDCRWGPPGAAGWDDLLVRVTRLSFRVQSLDPDAAEGDFRRALETGLFGGSAPAGVGVAITCRSGASVPTRAACRPVRRW